MEKNNKKALDVTENVCPHCGEHLYMNKRSFANHIRWCKSNPNYEKILNGTISKLKGNKVEHNKYIIKCENCGNEYEVVCTKNEFEKGKYKKTCCEFCAKQVTHKKSKQEKYVKISQSLKKYYGTYGNDKKKCPQCGNDFTMNKRNQVFCSIKCARLYRREKEIENWTEYQYYRIQCRFQFNLSDFRDEFDFDLITENGWYKAKNHGNNLKGVSRDHMFSIKRGYEMQIDPYLISHPANCELMLQTDNFRKLTDCSITKEKLVERVEDWNKKHGVYENKIIYKNIERFHNGIV